MATGSKMAETVLGSLFELHLFCYYDIVNRIFKSVWVIKNLSQKGLLKSILSNIQLNVEIYSRKKLSKSII